MEDLISRQAALDVLDDFQSNIELGIDDYAEKRKALCDLPSADRPIGHWILLDECTNSGYYCSECHKKVVKEGWSKTVKKINYCPNCGADMRGW